MSQYRRLGMLRSASDSGPLPSLLTSPCHSASGKFAVDFGSPLDLSTTVPRFLSKSLRPKHEQDSELDYNEMGGADLLPVPPMSPGKSCLKKSVPCCDFDCLPRPQLGPLSEPISTRTSTSSVRSLGRVSSKISFQDSFETDSQAGSEKSSKSSKSNKSSKSSKSGKREQKLQNCFTAMLDDCAMLGDCSSQEVSEADPTSPRSPPPSPSFEELHMLEARRKRRQHFKEMRAHDHKKSFQVEMHRANEKSLRMEEDEATSREYSPQYHFEVGELVTTLGGIEANGPWKTMGHGTVVGPGFQKGFLDIMFKSQDGSHDRFAIRAKNLTRVSELHVKKHVSGLSRRYGIKLGDAVIYKVHSKGVVLDEGPTPEFALVKFSGVGVRSVQLVHCLKVALQAELDEQKAARAEETRTGKADKSCYNCAERRTLRMVAAAEWAGVELTEEEGGVESIKPSVSALKSEKERIAEAIALSVHFKPTPLD